MFKNIYKDKKILITGNTGFKGSWLTLWLLNLGARVYGFSNGIPSSPSMYQELELQSKIHHVEGDINKLSKIEEVVSKTKPDFIFHLAAQALVSVFIKNLLTQYQQMFLGTANL